MSDEVLAAVIIGAATILATVVGVVLAGIRRKDKRMASTEQSTRSYGLRIVSPASGSLVARGEVKVSGVFMEKPPNDSLFLINASLNAPLYWPCVGRPPTEVSPPTKTWRASSWVNDDTRILVVTVGPSARALFDYYEKVGQQTGQWPPITRLTPDVIEHDEITVRVQRA